MSEVRAARAADANAMVAIYNYYIEQSVVTFEEQPIAADELARRVAAVQADGLPWLVAERERQVVGYAYATPWRARSAYRYSVETTVYVAHDAHRQGIGRGLYEALFASLRNTSARIAIGGITLPNAASVALHEAMGMEKVAHFREVGFKFDQWLDVGYWQCRLA